MTTPHFYILTATANRVERLRRAVDSVCQQSFEGWEMFLLDNGSEDETPALLAELAEDPRIHVARFDRPRGVNRARNALLEAILARRRPGFVLVLDDDDRLAPDALHQLADAIRKYPGDRWFVTPCCDEEGNQLASLALGRRIDYLRDHKFGQRMKGEVTHVFATSLVGESRYTDRFANSEEWYFYGDLAKRSEIVPLPFVTTTMEILAGGLTRTKPNRGRALEVNELKLEHWRERLNGAQRADLLCRISRHRLRAGDFAGARRALAEAAATWPFEPRLVSGVLRWLAFAARRWRSPMGSGARIHPGR